MIDDIDNDINIDVTDIIEVTEDNGTKWNRDHYRSISFDEP